MTSKEKFDELKEFILYHIRNNPKRTLKDILPFLNEFFRKVGEPSIKEKK